MKWAGLYIEDITRLDCPLLTISAHHALAAGKEVDFLAVAMGMTLGATAGVDSSSPLINLPLGSVMVVSLRGMVVGESANW
jgi:hypothetical protein